MAIIKYNLKISKEINQGFDNNKGVIVYSEEYSSLPLKWRGKNYYWVDTKTDLTLRTNQSIHPFEDRIQVDFYYK
jgi:hypothetical protein